MESRAQEKHTRKTFKPCFLGVIVSLSLLGWLAEPAQAATFGPIANGDVPALIDAIEAANANGEANTIILASNGTYTLSPTADVRIPLAVDGNNGLPSITTEITLQGNGSVIERDASLFTGANPCSSANANEKFRIIHVEEIGKLTLNDLTLQNGCTDGRFFVGNDERGGGIFSRGTLSLINSTVSGSTATAILAIGRGGGISSQGSNATVTLTHSTVSGNSTSGSFVSGFGGGIDNESGTVTLTHSTVSGNRGEFGGGINNDGGTMTLRHSTVSENRSFTAAEGQGAGISNRNGTVTLTHSTVRGNFDAVDGGGISNNGGTLTLINSTVSGNTAEGSGGGIFNRSNDTVTLTNSTVSRNTATGSTGGISNAGTLNLTNTIVADQAAGVDCSGIFISNNFNLDSDATCNLNQPNDKPNANANLGPLQINAPGNTATHALLPGSDAIDMGDCSGGTITEDQRGVPRPQGADCDIGAFEFLEVTILNDVLELTTPTTALNPTPAPNAPAGVFTITATFTNTGADDLTALLFDVITLTGGNLLLNANGGPGGVGAQLLPDLGDGLLSPGESVTVKFEIGLQTLAPFEFFVNALGGVQ